METLLKIVLLTICLDMLFNIFDEKNHLKQFFLLFTLYGIYHFYTKEGLAFFMSEDVIKPVIIWAIIYLAVMILTKISSFLEKDKTIPVEEDDEKEESQNELSNKEVSEKKARKFFENLNFPHDHSKPITIDFYNGWKVSMTQIQSNKWIAEIFENEKRMGYKSEVPVIDLKKNKKANH